jgi:hypothetical protein
MRVEAESVDLLGVAVVAGHGVYGDLVDHPRPRLLLLGRGEVREAGVAEELDQVMHGGLLQVIQARPSHNFFRLCR